jgi:hypothetical protein
VSADPILDEERVLGQASGIEEQRHAMLTGKSAHAAQVLD